MSNRGIEVPIEHATTNQVSVQAVTDIPTTSSASKKLPQPSHFDQTFQNIQHEPTNLSAVNTPSTTQQLNPVFSQVQTTEKRSNTNVELNGVSQFGQFSKAQSHIAPSSQNLKERVNIPLTSLEKQNPERPLVQSTELLSKSSKTQAPTQPITQTSIGQQLKTTTNQPPQLTTNSDFIPLQGAATQVPQSLPLGKDSTDKSSDLINRSGQLLKTNLYRTSNNDAPHQTSSESFDQPNISAPLSKSPGSRFPETQLCKSEEESLKTSLLLSPVPEGLTSKLNILTNQTKSNQITKSSLAKTKTHTSQVHNRISRTSVPIAPAPVFGRSTTAHIAAHPSISVMSNLPVSSPPVTSPMAPATALSVIPPSLTPQAAPATSPLQGKNSETVPVNHVANGVTQRHCAVNLKPVAVELINLITEYLRSVPTPTSVASNSPLYSFCTRMKDDDDPYRGNLDEMAWAVRDLIRMEFHKIPYPTPPSPGLLLLVSKTETLLTNSSNVSRPIYFPGARITAPTNDGTRRVGTTLQLRTKIIQSKPTVDAMLHLDGPDGGAFMWLQVTSLAPLGRVPASLMSAQLKGKTSADENDTVRGRGRRGRGSRGGARGSRSGRRVSRGQRPSVKEQASSSTKPKVQNSSSNGAPPVPQRGTQGTPPTSVATGSLSNPAANRNAVPVSRGTGSGRGASVARGSVASRSASNSRGPTVEQAPGVPTSLVCASPPPRSRIIGNSRSVSFTNGSLRRALDVSISDVACTAAKLQLVLGIERLVARRNVDSVGAQYFVKWSGRSVREGSWESRESLMEDVPGLVRDFDIRHPDESLASCPNMKSCPNSEEDKADTNLAVSEVQPTKVVTEKNSVESDKCAEDTTGKKRESDGDACGREKKVHQSSDRVLKEYVDDVSGVKIPSWVDSPILELTVCGMVLQFRRPDNYSLHTDVESAARDTKRRQAEFKKKNIEAAVRVFALSRTEAKFAIDHGLRAHKELNQHAIKFPRGLGRVSASDHGIPFAAHDAVMAPSNWDAYLLHLGMSPTDYHRDLPPYMPTTDPNSMLKLVNSGHEIALTMAQEHRERARSLVREAFRCDGAVTPPPKLFRDGVRLPPGTVPPPKKRARTGNNSTDTKKTCIDVNPFDFGFDRSTLLRERDDKVNSVIKELEVDSKISERSDGMWFDSVWACWRRAPASES